MSKEDKQFHSDDSSNYSPAGSSENPVRRWRKKSRCSNFDVEEKNLLIYVVKQYQNVIECKKSDKASCMERDAVWRKVAEEFNELSFGEHVRTSAQLKVCYENLKKKLRRQIGLENSDLDYKTEIIVKSNTTSCSSTNKDSPSNASTSDVETNLSAIYKQLSGNEKIIIMKERARCSNFSMGEKELLMKIIKKYQKFLDCKKTDNVNLQKRENIWRQLEHEFNALSTFTQKRTVLQLKVCYSNMKKRARRELKTSNIFGGVEAEMITQTCDPSFVVEVGSSQKNLERNIMATDILTEPADENQVVLILGDESLSTGDPMSNRLLDSSSHQDIIEDDAEKCSNSKRRIRCSNFSANEKSLLLDVVEKYKDTIECKKTDKASVEVREKVWECMKNEFNKLSSSSSKRTSRQLKICYENLERRNKELLGKSYTSMENYKACTELIRDSLSMDVSRSDVSDSLSVSSTRLAASPDMMTKDSSPTNRRRSNERRGRNCTARFRNRNKSLEHLKRILLVKEIKLMEWEKRMKAKKYMLEFRAAEEKCRFYRTRTLLLERTQTERHVD